MRRNDSTFFQMIDQKQAIFNGNYLENFETESAPLFEYDIWKGYQYDNFLIIPFWGIDMAADLKINLETESVKSYITHKKLKLLIML